MTWPAASVMLEAKLVFTSTLICTAALPRIAGPMSRRMLRRPGCAKSMRDRKSTRLNSSHLGISYAVFCLKKNNDHFMISGGTGVLDRVRIRADVGGKG